VKICLVGMRLANHNRRIRCGERCREGIDGRAKGSGRVPKWKEDDGLQTSSTRLMKLNRRDRPTSNTKSHIS
jgi:hypothetical protein